MINVTTARILITIADVKSKGCARNMLHLPGAVSKLCIVRLTVSAHNLNIEDLVIVRSFTLH